MSFDGRNSLWRKAIEFAASVLTMAFTGRKNGNFSSPLSDNKGGDRPTQLLSKCFSQLRVWFERVCLLRICPFCTKRSGDLEIFRYVAVVAGLNAIFA